MRNIQFNKLFSSFYFQDSLCYGEDGLACFIITVENANVAADLCFSLLCPTGRTCLFFTGAWIKVKDFLHVSATKQLSFMALWKICYYSRYKCIFN